MADQQRETSIKPTLLPQGDAQPDDLELAARRGDLRGVLSQLNERTRHRFTGLYAIEPPMLRNICLFDRENPSIDGSGATTVLDETFCAIVNETSMAFWTVDACTDERLDAPRIRGGVISYGGVPVALGARRGTLCHYDLRPRLLSAREVIYLQAVAPLIAPFLITAR